MEDKLLGSINGSGFDSGLTQDLVVDVDHGKWTVVTRRRRPNNARTGYKSHANFGRPVPQGAAIKAVWKEVKKNQENTAVGDSSEKLCGELLGGTSRLSVGLNFSTGFDGKVAVKMPIGKMQIESSIISVGFDKILMQDGNAHDLGMMSAGVKQVGSSLRRNWKDPSKVKSPSQLLVPKVLKFSDCNPGNSRVGKTKRKQDRNSKTMLAKELSYFSSLKKLPRSRRNRVLDASLVGSSMENLFTVFDKSEVKKGIDVNLGGVVAYPVMCDPFVVQGQGDIIENLCGDVDKLDSSKGIDVDMGGLLHTQILVLFGIT